MKAYKYLIAGGGMTAAAALEGIREVDATGSVGLFGAEPDAPELGYEAVGELDSRFETFEDWKKPNEEGVIYYLKNGRVRGVLLWNVWEKVDAARALIAEPGRFDAARLKGRIK